VGGAEGRAEAYLGVDIGSVSTNLVVIDPNGTTWCANSWEEAGQDFNAIDKDGKTVRFNKPEFVEAMRRFIQAWKDAYDETGTSWDDSNNNRAFHSGQISCTFNGSSIYFVAKKNFSRHRQRYEPYASPQGLGGPV
jgi:multiple sugar transport system substrate-binding protein